jgi:hypothetical protein
MILNTICLWYDNEAGRATDSYPKLDYGADA